MTGAGAVLRDIVRREGPIPFRRFMETALYHPEFGYYRRACDPFGTHGDFFTAEQVQPAFGILLREAVRRLFVEMGSPAEFTVVELGAGREEMAEAFREWRYVPVDIGRGALPERFSGVIFSNEFFDALPVEVAEYSAGAFRSRLVGLDGERFVWIDGPPVADDVSQFIHRWLPPPEEGLTYEASPDALRWLERIAAALDEGYVLTIDYGYTRREWVRFPRGALMGYRRHVAHDEVLEEPGERDITAHVNFSALEEYGAALGLETLRFETLARTLLNAGERDSFASVLEAETEAERLRRRMQLKTLLFGMGETFRTLLQRKRRA